MQMSLTTSAFPVRLHRMRGGLVNRASTALSIVITDALADPIRGHGNHQGCRYARGVGQEEGDRGDEAEMGCNVQRNPVPGTHVHNDRREQMFSLSSPLKRLGGAIALSAKFLG